MPLRGNSGVSLFGDIVRCVVAVPLIVAHEATGDLLDVLLGEAYRPEPWSPTTTTAR